MRILVVPQEFKGSLDAVEAATAIEVGARRAAPSAEVVLRPMADGGPGTVEVIAAARGAELVTGVFTGPLGAPVEATFAFLPATADEPATAFIEAAATAGLVLVEPSLRDPGRASTVGVGEQVRAALERGARRIIVGVGGTGTNDGGAGAAIGLGYRLLDGRGRPLLPGALNLAWLSRIDASGADERLRDAEVIVAADVTNLLLGREGATAVYGAQKGVHPALGRRLEPVLTQWATICRRDLGVDMTVLAGSGAGGGLAGGLAATCHARIESGAAVVADAIGLRAQVSAADLVVTGEGQIDSQTPYGKVVAYVASVAGELGVPCVAVAGSVLERPPGLSDVEASAGDLTALEAMSRGAALVEAAAERVVGRFIERGPGERR